MKKACGEADFARIGDIASPYPIIQSKARGSATLMSEYGHASLRSFRLSFYWIRRFSVSNARCFHEHLQELIIAQPKSVVHSCRNRKLPGRRRIQTTKSPLASYSCLNSKREQQRSTTQFIGHVHSFAPSLRINLLVPS